MHYKYLHHLLTPVLWLYLPVMATAQTKVFIQDGRQSAYCTACEKLLHDMPKEVLFGIDIHTDGDVYFSMSNMEWFNKLFTGAQDGVSVDLVLKEQYACNTTLPNAHSVSKGVVLPPVYLAALKKNMEQLTEGHFAVKVGQVPKNLLNKELEGNLIIIKNGVVCHYTSFVDIPRSSWALLPMGMYTDTLLNVEPGNETDTTKAPRFYSKRLQFTIPFLKNKAVYDTKDIKPLYDSLQLKDYSIKSIHIRAYSSIEGAEQANNLLQQQRAKSIVKALQQFQTREIKTTITAGENWIEFYNDIAQSPHKDLADLDKATIKSKLLDKALLDQLEPYLKNHRKAIITIYLNKKTGLERTKADSLVMQFKKAIEKKQVAKASIIQDAIFDRVADGKLPEDYINQLEIPHEAIFSDLKNDQITYKLLLNITYEEEALEELKEIETLSPSNGKIKYNICVLTFRMWQYDARFVQPDSFLLYINELPKTGIDSSLVKRMLINHHIIMCGIYMSQYRYDAKDEAVKYIYLTYVDLQLSDEDILAMAKFLCYYSQMKLSELLLEKRVHQLDVNEDLLFYYLNLKLFYPAQFSQESIQKAVQNAIGINRKRYCRFFNAMKNGGASFQLLEYNILRDIYCDNCK
jgi:hypothetical protein